MIFQKGIQMLKIYNECCKNCLLSPDRIVSGKRAKEIVKDCVRKQTHFQCHKSPEGEDIMCKGFFDSFGHYSQMVRIAERLKMLKYVPQPDGEKLPTYLEMSRKNKSKKV